MAECSAFKIRCPATMLIVGGSGVGKTEFLLKLINNADTLMDKPIKKIIWCNGISTDIDEQLASNELFLMNPGLPDLALIDEIVSIYGPGCMLVLDDLATEIRAAPDLFANLYSRISHHRSLSVVTILQNLFSVPRTARLSCSYICLLRSTSDMQYIFSLGRQLFDRDYYKSFLEAFKDATSKPYGFLFLDLHTRSDDSCRLLGDIFNETITVYVPKKK